MSIIPLTVVSAGLDTVIGVLAECENVTSVSKKGKFFFGMFHHMLSLQKLLPKVHHQLILAINPKAEFTLGKKRHKSNTCCADDGGLCTEKIHRYRKIIDCETEDDLLHRYVLSRFHITRELFTLIGLRALDGSISLVVVPLSLITAGEFVKINNIACASLNFPGVVGDVFLYETFLKIGVIKVK